MKRNPLIIREVFYSIVLVGLTIMFMYFNFDPQLGTAFGLMLILAVAAMLLDYMFIDRKVNIPLQRTSIFKSAVYGLVAYAVFLGVSSIIMSFVGSFNIFALGSVLELMAESQPVFAGAALLTFIGWGLHIPNIESYFFFGKLNEVVISIFKIPLSIKSFSYHLLSLVFASIFALFHLTAKIGLGAKGFNEAIILVFLFGYASMLLVAITKEALSAIFMHMFANSISIGLSFGIFQVSQLLMIGAVTFGVLFIISKVYQPKFVRK